MKKTYQTIIEKGNGNCMQAALASLFNLELTDVPHFLSYGEDCFKVWHDFIKNHGYEQTGVLFNKNYNRLLAPTACCFKKEAWYRPGLLSITNLKKHGGVDGFFYASVYSPKYFNYKDGFMNTHAVIVDINCNVVHDPNPEYEKIIKYPLADLLKFNGILDVTLIKKL
jgi:hypothetical protein